MDAARLEITKLKWRVQILQRILANLWMDFYPTRTGESPQESHQQLLTYLDTTKEHQYTLLSASTLPEDERFLLADAYAEVVEEMKTSITSMLAG